MAAPQEQVASHASGDSLRAPLPRVEWAEELFAHSPLKKEKLRRVRAFLPTRLEGLNLLDIGGDNGVLSYKLRQLGGRWASADLIPETVRAIRSLVGDPVYEIGDGEGGLAALPKNFFDVIAVVDMLEHLEHDECFIDELETLLTEDGVVIVNVPNPKEGWLRRLRFRLGQTDEQHGHVRPGYSEDDLRRLFQGRFEITASQSYSRFCAQLVDTVINGGLHLLKAGKGGKKGTIVTEESFSGSRKNSFLLRIVSPLLRVMLLLDAIFPFTHGSMVIVRAERVRKEQHE
ncbi:class I SAM-dependent methyltransferase [bacterium]|nr:class I SAM-dependent methyltransferase [bacterium]